mgnify:CR=1 FL=1
MDALVSPAYVRTMAAYNAEMNRRLYAAAGRIPDPARRQDRGAFWGSLHGTLSHLLWGDRIWMARFDGWEKPAVIQKDSATMVADFDELRGARIETDENISAWAGRVTKAWFAAQLRGDAFLQPPDPPPRPGACAAVERAGQRQDTILRPHHFPAPARPRRHSRRQLALKRERRISKRTKDKHCVVQRTRPKDAHACHRRSHRPHRRPLSARKRLGPYHARRPRRPDRP